MRHLTCKTTQTATKCNQEQNRDPHVTIGLLKPISTQKVYKTYDKQGSILHYLGTNQEAFQELKKRLTSAPILIVPDKGQGYTVYYDASRARLGCVLM